MTCLIMSTSKRISSLSVSEWEIIPGLIMQKRTLPYRWIKFRKITRKIHNHTRRTMEFVHRARDEMSSVVWHHLHSSPWMKKIKLSPSVNEYSVSPHTFPSSLSLKKFSVLWSTTLRCSVCTCTSWTHKTCSKPSSRQTPNTSLSECRNCSYRQ